MHFALLQSLMEVERRRVSEESQMEQIQWLFHMLCRKESHVEIRILIILFLLLALFSFC